MSIKLGTLLDCLVFQSLWTCSMGLKNCLSRLHVYSVVSNQLSGVSRKETVSSGIDRQPYSSSNMGANGCCSSLRFFQDHKREVTCVAYNWNDCYIASGSLSGEIILHSVTTNTSSTPFGHGSKQVWCLCLFVCFFK